MSKVLRAVVVARVSTVEQAGDNKHSIQEQLRVGRARAEVDGWEVVDEFKELGVSGAKPLEHRPVIQRLLRDAAAKKFDIAIWSKLDRLSRKVQTGLALIEALQQRGIRVVIHDPPIDTKTPMGQFAVTMLLAVSELEKGMIQERMSTGVIANLKHDDRFWPGGRVAFGYKLGPEGLEADKPKQKILQTMFQRVAQGETTGEVARWLNGKGVAAPAGVEWRHATVGRILANESYASGIVRHTIKGDDGQAFDIRVPVLVDRDVFDAAQKKLNARREYQNVGKRADNPSYPLSARVIHVHEDGAEFNLWARPRPYWRRKQVHGKSVHVGEPRIIREMRCEQSIRGGETCDGFGITKRGQKMTAVVAPRLEVMVLKWLLPALIGRGTFTALANGHLEDIEGEQARELLTARLETLARKRERTVEAFVDGLFDKAERGRRFAEIDADLDQTKHDLAELGGTAIDPDLLLARIRHLVGSDITPSYLNRLRKKAGGDPDKAIRALLESVLDEAENLGDDGELSPVALEVLTSLVDRLAVRVIIERDWTHPRIEAGGVNLAVRSGISISETMRMSSNYSQ